MKEKAVVLISGGLDSTVVLSEAVSRGFECYGLTIDYGQRHSTEIESAKRIATVAKIKEHKVFKMDLRNIGGSSLTTDLAVPKGRDPAALNGIPDTYVPARNTIFLSLALSWAEVLDARDIFLGVSSVDYSGYPDCRPKYVEAFEQVANLGTKAADKGPKYRIHAPLLHISKAETILLGLSKGVDFSQTWTCYDPLSSGRPCLACESCQLRAKGFQEAGKEDPLLSGRQNDK